MKNKNKKKTDVPIVELSTESAEEFQTLTMSQLHKALGKVLEENPHLVDAEVGSITGFTEEAIQLKAIHGLMVLNGVVHFGALSELKRAKKACQEHGIDMEERGQ